MAMLSDLSQIGTQGLQRFRDLRILLAIEIDILLIQQLFQIIHHIIGHLAKVNDKVQGVLYLMGDACA